MTKTARRAGRAPVTGDALGARIDALTDEQRRITQDGATEPPFTGKYLGNKADGTYFCAVCDTPLFSSEHKYESGSGWPSFWLPLAGDNVRTERDLSHGMVRDEVSCANCGAHLGHVFPDGPQPTGLRYCINSASLDFGDNGREDLRLVRGIGPAMARELAAWGVRTLSQLADLDETRIDALDRELRFPGRIRRERWVEQARELTGRE